MNSYSNFKMKKDDKQLQKYMINFRYKEAFLLARRQRLNLNLLVDHDPKLFMDNIKEFVLQVNNSHTWYY